MSSRWNRFSAHISASAAICAACAFLPVRGHAQGLVLRVPTACGNLDGFVVRVDELAGEHAAERAEASVVIVQRAAGDYRLDVKLKDQRRRSRHADCRVLLEAAALVVAFSVNPALAQETAPKETDGEHPTAQSTNAGEPLRAARSLRVVPHVEVALWHGVLPRVGVPLGLGASLGFDELALGLALRYAYPVASEGTPRVVAQAFGATLLARHAFWPFLEAGAGMDFDLLEARGRGVTESQRDVTSREAVRLELLARPLRRGRQALSLVSAASFAVHRGSFVARGLGRVFRPDFMALSLALRWELSIL